MVALARARYHLEKLLRRFLHSPRSTRAAPVLTFAGFAAFSSSVVIFHRRRPRTLLVADSGNNRILAIDTVNKTARVFIDNVVEPTALFSLSGAVLDPTAVS